MIKRGYLRYIYIFIAISFAVNILYISSPNESVFAKKDKDADNEKDKDQLVVNTIPMLSLFRLLYENHRRIHIQNFALFWSNQTRFLLKIILE